MQHPLHSRAPRQSLARGEPKEALNELQVADINAIYRMLDSQGKGFLSRDETKLAFLGLLGYTPSEFELSLVEQTIDIDKQGYAHLLSLLDPALNNDITEMTRANLVRFMAPKLSLGDADGYIRRMFLEFDIKRSGFLDRAGVAAVFRRFLPHLPDGKIQHYFDRMDENGDGKISYREFETVMRRGLAARNPCQLGWTDNEARLSVGKGLM
ncbi:uncharacterized protein BJ171DRAFT_241910 [Polychytrium aggregatum]|uniref:uncharacterized protein n=1 Tax=Polychytrium aggregatum TaxID=110093 RepID=UPI0022FF4535|nr:uncharacterized protein BJ171DRAFT_241910 [Polychytrium aggregatum]KAI9197083.1 hypothetical protein BJ171DRAFT_241910 [Polychytrium aggregatum]